MSKFKPLWEFIKKYDKQKLTFDEIKNILGFELDHSFLNHKKELIEYGYIVSKISKKEKLIKFCKI